MRNRFFNKKFKSLTLKQIIEITGSKVDSKIDLEQKVIDVATVDKANKDQISFLNSGQYLEKLQSSQAGFCLMEEKYKEKAPDGMVVLSHKNPYFAYAQIANSFYEENKTDFPSEGLIHQTAKIGEGTKIAPNAYIGKNVEIGKNCFVGPSASIMDGCIIGDNTIINSNATISFSIIGKNCIIYAGARIGQDGFGFAHDSGVNHKIIQLGIVEIGDDIEVGANSCVDRGAIENTKIGNGTKLDNLVQVAHNVVIGEGTFIAGCAALAGSAKVGNFVQVGGNSSISGHLTVGDGAKVAGMSGVIRDVEPMKAVAGIPVVPIKQWHRINTTLVKMTSFNKKS